MLCDPPDRAEPAHCRRIELNRQLRVVGVVGNGRSELSSVASLLERLVRARRVRVPCGAEVVDEGAPGSADWPCCLRRFAQTISVA